MLYILLQAVRTHRTMKKCEPIHKKFFRVKGTGKLLQTRLYVIVLILFAVTYFISVYSYGFRELILLDVSSVFGYTMFATLFRQGKIGEKGVSIAHIFIPWDDLHNAILEWLPITHSHYPNGELTLTTRSHQTYIIMVEKKYEKEISDLLQNKIKQ